MPANARGACQGCLYDCSCLLASAPARSCLFLPCWPCGCSYHSLRESAVNYWRAVGTTRAGARIVRSQHGSFPRAFETTPC